MFVPTVLFDMGVGAIFPIVAAAALSLGASLEVAGFMLALVAIGQLLGDLPAGALAERLGDRRAMVSAGILAAAGYVLAATAPSPIVLGGAMVVLGGTSSVYFLARQSSLTAITPPLHRARVMSTLGGVHRVGDFLGPFAGALVISLLGVNAVFWAAAVLSLLAAAVVWLAGEEDVRTASPGPSLSTAQVIKSHWRPLVSLGFVALMIGAVRGARITVLPLWAAHVGIDPASTSLIFGLAAAVDMLLFYPAGQIMDRYGRLWIGVPAMAIMGAALLALPFTSTPMGLSLVALLLGLGNGLSAGILMTLSADVAPTAGRSQFLGVWRLFADSGRALGPAVLSVGAAAGSLAAGVWVMAAASGLSAGIQTYLVPRYDEHASRRSRRRAGIA